MPPSFPVHPPGDPAAIERGKGIYSVNCQFCHGVDARGGDGGGPNLIRSQIVLEDKAGEGIGPVILAGRGSMPKFAFSAQQISDVAAFLHNFKVGGGTTFEESKLNILVGDAAAGKAYFEGHCTSCHSVSGDLKGIGSREPDAKQLQNSIVSGSAKKGFPFAPPQPSKPTTVSITLASGEKVEGPLVRIDDFTVTVRDSSGGQRTFTRSGDVPKVEVHDSLQPHVDLLPLWQDKDIHDLTAYLITLK
jgi:mono/diheme cytochrome c family protein